MKKILSPKFFQKPAPAVARNLLGKVIVRKFGNKIFRVVITETEAYLGSRDLASHARFGKTKRNLAMFGDGGHWYVYLVYGMHWMLNVVTEEDGSPSAVLIRSGIIIGSKPAAINGPAKIAKRLRISGSLTGKLASKNSGLWVEDWGIKIGTIKKSPRIGVDYAGPWSKKLLRFTSQISVIQFNPYGKKN